jgi:hypothetical protein
MEQKIYLKYKNESFKILKISQTSSSDIVIMPKNSKCLTKEIINGFAIGDELEIETNKLNIENIDHFTAHAESGQRHFKFNTHSFAYQPEIGFNFLNIKHMIPLVTIVATANMEAREEPKGKWFGYELSDDCNYIVMDIFAIPKDFNFNMKTQVKIQNDIKTTEFFDIKVVEMKTCNIYIQSRATNHKLTNIPYNIAFQLVEGKTVVISRVEDSKIFAQIAKLEISNQ